LFKKRLTVYVFYNFICLVYNNTLLLQNAKNPGKGETALKTALNAYKKRY
jgi:hypothetical protein